MIDKICFTLVERMGLLNLVFAEKYKSTQQIALIVMKLVGISC